MDLQSIAFFLFGFTLSCLLVQNFLLDSSFNENLQKVIKYLPASRYIVKDDPRVLYNESVADQIFSDVKVLCWVMTHPANHKNRTMHIKATWGKRCNTLLFMSTSFDADLPTIQLNYSDGREFLWYKTRDAFQYVYDHHFNDADWFMRTDDDKCVDLNEN